MVAITETWVSKRTTALTLTGYTPVSRLDRRVGRPHRCGIVVFVWDDSPIDERSWHIVHCDFGPVLVCVWYSLPVRGEPDSIRRFTAELDSYSQDRVAVLAVGDFNVHEVEWLRFFRWNQGASWNMSATNAV